MLRNNPTTIVMSSACGSVSG